MITPTFDSAAFGSSMTTEGPITTAFRTVAYKDDFRQFIDHAFAGALKCGLRVTATQDLNELRKLRGKGWQYAHRGTFRGSSKAYFGHMTNAFDVDMLFDHWEKHGLLDTVYLPSGAGLTKTCVKHFTRIPWDIDDGPMGAIPTEVQCRMFDEALAAGVHISDVVTTGDDRPAPLSPFDPKTHQKGKGLHGGANFRATDDEVLREATVHAYIVYFDADTACDDPGRRMRSGGRIATGTDKEPLPGRIQTWLYRNDELPTLQQVHDRIVAACHARGIDNIEEQFEALKKCAMMKGPITKLTKRIAKAREMGDVADAAQMEQELAEFEAIRLEMRTSRVVHPQADALTSKHNKLHPVYDPRPKAATRVPAAAQAPDTPTTPAPSFMPPISVVKGAQYNPNAQYASATGEPWDFQNTVFIIRKAGTVIEGTATELYAAHGNKARGIVSNVLCPLCGKQDRPHDATPSAMLSMHKDMAGATLKCSSCSGIARSIRSKGGGGGGGGKKVTYVSPLERLQNATTWSHSVDISKDKYVPQFEMKDKVVLCTVPQGMGKTEWLVRRAATDLTRKMLVIVPTRALAENAYGRLKDYGFELYSSIEENSITATRLVCCVDSVRRIDDSMVFDDVIVEEAHSTFRRLNDDKMRSRDLVWESLCFISRSAEHVVLLDGCLTEVDWLAVSKMADVTTGQLVWGRKSRGVTITVHDSFPSINRARTLGLGQGGGREFIYSNTLADADALAALTPAGRKMMVVSSRTTGEEAVLDLLADPNARVQELDTLIGTPSMGQGVDISVKHFDRVFVVAQSGNFTDPENVVQGFWRDRVCTNRHLWVSERAVGEEEDPKVWVTRMSETVDAEIRAMNDMAGRFDLLLFPRSSQAMRMSLVEVRAAMHAEQARGRNNLREHVYGMLMDQGVKLVHARKLGTSAIKKALKDYSGHKKTVKAVEHARIADAEKMDIDVADRLQRKRKVSADERRAIKKAKLVDLIGTNVDLTGKLVGEFEDEDLRSRIYQYAAVNAFVVGNGEEYATARSRTYDEDSTRAESGSGLAALHASKFLVDVFGCGEFANGGGVSSRNLATGRCDNEKSLVAKITKNNSMAEIATLPSATPRADNCEPAGDQRICKGRCLTVTVKPLDAAGLERYNAALSTTPNSVKFILGPKADTRPMLALRSLLTYIGVQSKGHRCQRDGETTYSVSVDIADVRRMHALSAVVRERYAPAKTFEWVIDGMKATDDAVGF